MVAPSKLAHLIWQVAVPGWPPWGWPSSHPPRFRRSFPSVVIKRSPSPWCESTLSKSTFQKRHVFIHASTCMTGTHRCSLSLVRQTLSATFSCSFWCGGNFFEFEVSLIRAAHPRPLPGRDEAKVLIGRASLTVGTSSPRENGRRITFRDGGRPGT